MMIGVGLVAALGFSAGCGDDDDGGGSADCSECSGDAADTCNETYDECRDAGGSHGECEPVAQIFCGLSGSFGDAGTP